MARGKDLHDAHSAAVAALGRPLSRRARSRCELCEDTGALRVVEVPPVAEEPDPDAAIMVCDRCRELLTAKKLRPSDDQRFLEGVMWSEVPPVQVAAVRLLRRLSGEHQVEWATDALDGLWLPEEIQERVDG